MGLQSGWIQKSCFQNLSSHKYNIQYVEGLKGAGRRRRGLAAEQLRY